MHTPIFRTEEPLWFLLETAWCSQTQMGLSESTVWDLQSLMGAHQMWTLGDAGMGPSEMPRPPRKEPERQEERTHKLEADRFITDEDPCIKAARREAQLAAARDMLFVPRRRARSLDRALLLAEVLEERGRQVQLRGRERAEEDRQRRQLTDNCLPGAEQTTRGEPERCSAVRHHHEARVADYLRRREEEKRLELKEAEQARQNSVLYERQQQLNKLQEYGQNKKWKELTREQVEERRALEEKRRCEERQLEVSVTTGGQDDPPPGLDPISVLCHHTRQKRYSF
ncbi:hypothetical protein FJT64_024026 [Amphibalanus amphitrite]|uniref:Uncharacterized protein n=1 Tax=Amphibalanus amphitrite TaxID=1232801 RepID=A0A6A4WKB1_AMPAM|nr:hypothetical protein FJT64_024026 [Amphibalanus amphitrite]